MPYQRHSFLVGKTLRYKGLLTSFVALIALSFDPMGVGRFYEKSVSFRSLYF